MWVFQSLQLPTGPGGFVSCPTAWINRTKPSVVVSGKCDQSHAPDFGARNLYYIFLLLTPNLQAVSGGDPVLGATLRQCRIVRMDVQPCGKGFRCGDRVVPPCTSALRESQRRPLLCPPLPCVLRRVEGNPKQSGKDA